MVQEVRGKSLSGAPGIGLVAAVVALLWLISRGLTLLQRHIGYTAASVLLWACGIAVALGVLRLVMGYRYELRGEEFTVQRLYGRRVRLMEKFLLRSVLACGAPEEVKRRFPQASVQRAARRDCHLPVLAVAYRANGVKILMLQPESGLREAIERAARGGK